MNVNYLSVRTNKQLKILGNQDEKPSSASTANRRAVQYTFTEDGDIISISMYHTAVAGRLLYAIYSDVAGVATTLLGVTDITDSIVAAGFQTVNLLTPVSVVNGQTIWIAFVYENTTGFKYEAVAPTRVTTTAVFADGMPTSFGAGTYANGQYSIYCTYWANA